MTTEGTPHPVTEAMDMEELIDQNRRLFDKIKEGAEILKERAEFLGDELEAQKQIMKIQQAALDLTLKDLQAMKDQNATHADFTKYAAENLELQIAIAAEARATGGTYEDILDKMVASGDAQKYLVKLTQQQKARIADIDKTFDSLGSKGQKFAKSMGLAGKFTETNLGKTVELAKAMKQVAIGGKSFSDVMGSTFSASFNMLNTLGSILDILGKFVIETDNVAKNFSKTTGITGQFRDNIQSVSANLVAAGVSAEDVGKGYSALAANYSMFDKNNQAVNEELLTNIALLEKVGVGAAESAQNMDFLTRSMGMNQLEASKLNMEIATMGDGMGITASKMMSDFKAVSGTLSVYGDRMTGVFQRLAATAKATGIEVSSLVALGQRFDTFSDAATNAGKLNAVLGTNISAMEMMNMNEEERIQLLRQQIKMSVGDMNNLDKYTQQFIAQQMGLKDVGEARALLNMSEQEYLDMQGEQAASAKTQEEMLALTEQLVPVLEQFKMSFMKAALALTPFIELMSMFLDLLAPIAAFLSKYPEVIYAVVLAMGAWKMAVHAYLLAENESFIVKGVHYLLDKKKLLLTYLSTAAESKNTVVKWLATKASLALGSANLFALGAVLLVVAALYLLYKAFHKKGSPELYLMFGVIALGVIAFGIALYFIQGPAQIALLLIVALAFAVALMFYSIGDIIEGITGLVGAIAPLGAHLMAAGGGLWFMATGLLAVGAAGIISASGIILAAGALTAMLGVMKLGGMNFGDLIAVGQSVENIGSGIEKFASGLEKIKSIGAELGEITGKGFLAVRSDGGSTSMVMGSDSVMQNFLDGKLTVDVKIPEIKLPEITLNVTVNNDKVDVKKIIGSA